MTPPGSGRPIRFAEVISALSYALDITEGQPEGHSVRSCLIGMRIADAIGLDEERKSALFYGLILKDLGCSSNAAKVCSLFAADDRSVKHGLKTTDWTKITESFRYVSAHAAPGASAIERAFKIASIGLAGPAGAKDLYQTRCDRGADIARILGLPDRTAEAIRTLDEHWDGNGQPAGLRRAQIPLEGRILCLAQTVEVYAAAYGVTTACVMARERSGKWFDPELVELLRGFETDAAFWEGLWSERARKRLEELEPGDHLLIADLDRLQRIGLGFAKVVDAKSPWTYHHSEGVATIAVGIGAVMGFDQDTLRTLRLSALLHDVGKLGISNLILDKPAGLTDQERTEIRRHVEHTYHILRRVESFQEVAEIAGSHHERLDGKGYWRGLTAAQLPPVVRALSVADFCEALIADRPYRAGLPLERVLAIMGEQVGSGICAETLEALRIFLDRVGYQSPRAAQDQALVEV